MNHLLEVIAHDALAKFAYADWLEECGLPDFVVANWRLMPLPRRLKEFGIGSSGIGDGSNGSGSSGIGGSSGGSGGSGDGGSGGGSGSGGDGGSSGGSGGDGGGDGGGGSGGDGGGGGGDGGGGENFMPKVGENVLLHSRGAYYPYVWCGKVKAIVGVNAFILEKASLLPHTREEGVTWIQIAEGNPRARSAVRIRVAKRDIEVFDVCYCEPWEGELPTKDQH